MASVKGVSSVIAELQKFGKNIDKSINYETEAIALQIELKAKELAPKNFGKLSQSISTSQPISDRNKALISRVVTVNEMYGAYVEFGTGKKFKPIADAEFSKIAASFKGKKPGTFEKGVQSIEAWLRAKGGDPKDAKWILLRIIGAGINPQPFLYPAWVKGKKDYLDNLKKLLLKMNKKI